MRRPKIAVIGAGPLAAAAAERIAGAHLGDVVHVGAEHDRRPRGGGGPRQVRRGPPSPRSLPELDAALGSDVIVVAFDAGRGRESDHSEAHPLSTASVGATVERVVRKSRDGRIVVATRPFGATCETARQASGLPGRRIVGLAGVVESARIRAALAAELEVSPRSVAATVIGGCGRHPILLTRYTSVAGVPATALMAPDKLAAISDRVLGSPEIVDLGPREQAVIEAAGVTEVVASIVADGNEIKPCAAYLDGEFGLNHVWAGVPCKLGRDGVAGVFEISLTEEERAVLEADAIAASPVRAGRASVQEEGA